MLAKNMLGAGSGGINYACNMGGGGGGGGIANEAGGLCLKPCCKEIAGEGISGHY